MTTPAHEAGRALHLVTVWNPHYGGVDAHLTLLLDWARRCDEKKCGADDVYVWWGKIRSPNRQQPMAHADDIRSIARGLDERDENGSETHLYVTDYRTLYVADLIDIHEGDLPATERDHAPEYYRRQDLSCDFWFRIADLRRLIADDLPAVGDELRRLNNVHYHDKPVSLYGGFVDLPLIVTRPDDARFFVEKDRDVVTDGRLWCEYDLESGGGIAAIQKELRENVLGEAAWNALEWTSKTCIAGAEKLYREHRNDLAYDFGPVIANFGKALEVQCNAVVRSVAGRLPPEARHVNVNGQGVEIARTRFTLGQLAHAVGGDRDLNLALSRLLENGQWFTQVLPLVIDAFTQVRNPGVHEKRVERDAATLWRNQLMGVGSKGHFVDLAQVKAKAR